MFFSFQKVRLYVICFEMEAIMYNFDGNLVGNCKLSAKSIVLTSIKILPTVQERRGIAGCRKKRVQTQLRGRLFSPSDICKKLSHHFLLHFPIGMGSYDHHAKYQGVFP